MELDPEQRAAIERARGQDGDVEPPWSRYPGYTRWTIGWRMGDGEGWMYTWGDFLGSELTSIPDRIAYLRRHPKAPETWRDMLWNVLANDGAADDAEDDPIDALIAEYELIGDDVAYPRWVENAVAAGGVVAPWASRHALRPAQAMRYSCRETSFWARWCHEQRRVGGLAAWLESQPRAVAGWATGWARVIAALGDGPLRKVWDPRVSTLCQLVREGSPPPPWLRADQPPNRSSRYNLPLRDYDVWSWWVSDVIDDASSWARYTSAWPPAPPAWRDASLQLPAHRYIHTNRG